AAVGLALRRAGAGVVLLAAAVALARVVGDVPAAALQLEARLRDETPHLPLAFRALGEGRIGDPLHLLEHATVLAGVLVDGHRPVGLATGRDQVKGESGSAARSCMSNASR